MAYDKFLTQRFRDGLGNISGVTEKKMMGGVCFMINGNMIGGCDRQIDGSARYMFRVGKSNQAEALTRPGATQTINGTKRIGGFIYVGGESCNDDQLKSWIALAMSFVGSLPPV